MKSNACRIEKGSKDLEAIFKECQLVAQYCELNHKQSLQLRLLCEELDGMLPQIVGDFDGLIWFEFNDKLCKIKVSIDIEDITLKAREQLVSVAKNNKNAAAKGIVGKIRSAIEGFFLDTNFCDAVIMSSCDLPMAYGCDIVDYSYYWSLNQYKSTTNKEEEAEAWDELEKSVIAAVADDVIIGVKGNHADIIIVKNFA